MDIDLHFLRHAVALSEFKHFGLAAKSLSLSQPALSRSIHTLEDKLGAPLFIRGTKTVEPTDYGRLFLERAQELLNAANMFSKQLVDAGQQNFGRLVIGSGPFPAEGVVAAAMARFLTAYPDVELKICIRGPEELLLALQNAELEFFVSETSDFGNRLELHVTPMTKHKAVFVARAGHPLAGNVPPLEQVLHYPLALPSRLPPRVYGPLYSAWKMVAAKSRRPLPSIECASLAIVKRIVLESDAITAMPLSWLEVELDSGALVLLRSEPWLHTNYGFVQRKGAVLSQQAAAFKTLLLEEESALERREKVLRKRYKLV
jgi:DNA-binding transcriptional LysR family regulator